MIWQELLTALGLMLVLEGILPFVQPGQWRRAMLLATRFDDRTLRAVGLGSMLLGLVVVALVR